jgi:hypothetical protein
MGVPKEKKIDILLQEYQQTLSNRNHYHSIRWTMGTLFITATFSLFGASFLKELLDQPVGVVTMGVFSLLLLAVWVAFSLHGQTYVDTCHIRLNQIEKQIQDLAGTDFPKLHHEIGKAMKEKRVGTAITIIMLHTVVTAWIVRIWLLPSMQQYPWFFVSLWLAILIWMLYFYYPDWQRLKVDP